MKTIALIDDTQADLTLLWHWVKKMPGYQPVSFLDPIEALDWCLNNRPELIIIDSMSSDIDSIGFITQFRKKCPKNETPILIIIDNELIDIRHQALQSGANDYLNKPIDKTEFSFRTDTLLTLHHCHKKLTDKVDLSDVTTSFAMEELKQTSNLPLSYI